MIRTLALMTALAAPASSAFAGTVVVTHHVAPPVHRTVTTSTVHVAPAPRVVTPAVRVGVAFDPWTPWAVPVARPGYGWVPGHYDAYNVWYPGYYRPAEVRPGYVFEPGYWNGGVYVEGYWRPEHVERSYWIPGHYTAARGWVPGHWGA